MLRSNQEIDLNKLEFYRLVNLEVIKDFSLPDYGKNGLPRW